MSVDRRGIRDRDGKKEIPISWELPKIATNAHKRDFIERCRKKIILFGNNPLDMLNKIRKCFNGTIDGMVQ